MESRRYPTDLSEKEWGLLEPYLPAPKWRGRPRLHSPREILNAVFYVLKTGCQWRMLPREFPPWKTVFHYFRAWRLDGTWERLNRAMRERLRAQLGRDPQPSAGAFKLIPPHFLRRFVSGTPFILPLGSTLPCPGSGVQRAPRQATPRTTGRTAPDYGIPER
jgi:transposase